MLSGLYFIAFTLVAGSSLFTASKPAGGGYHDHIRHHHHKHDHTQQQQLHLTANTEVYLERLLKSLNGSPIFSDLSDYLIEYCPREAAAVDESSFVEMNLYGPDPYNPLKITEQHRKRSWRGRDIRLLAQDPRFNLSQPTLIYLGGWRQNKRRRWLVIARKVHANLIAANKGLSPYNLLLFDWSEYTDQLYYPSAAQVPHLGGVLADFIEQLIRQHNYRADQIHIVSFSLSTHIAGLAGRQLQSRKLGRLSQITAIEPTAVCFQNPLTNGQYGKKYAIRASDAKLVVARHYDMDLYGAREFIGGVDIVVNGGKDQPGTWYLQTDHQRGATHEAAMSMNWNQQQCSDVAYECESYEKFQRGQCADCGQDDKSCLMISTLVNVVHGRKLADEGLKPGTVMYIDTGFNMLCTQTYQIVVKLLANSSTKVKEMFRKGQVKYLLASKTWIEPRHELISKSGQVSFTSLLKVRRDGVHFYHQLNEYSLEVFSSLESISINYMSSTSAEIRNNKSICFCPDELALLRLIRCTAQA